MTVDWGNWLTKTPQEQQAIWARYRAIIKDEAENARYSRYRAMDEVMREVGYGR